MLSPEEVAERLAPLERAGVIVDADGTLAPIAPRPELARVLPEAAEALAGLVGRAALTAVVSGRPGDEVETLVGVAGVRYVGLYGVQGARPVAPALVRRVQGVVSPFTGAWVEPKGVSISVHVRGTPDPDAAEEALGPLLQTVARAEGMEIVRGKRTLELAPAGQPRKGAAIERLVATHDLRAVLYAGDDRPDLEAFEALDRLRGQGIATVKVAVHGPETPPALGTAADLVVDGPGGLAALLRAL